MNTKALSSGLRVRTIAAIVMTGMSLFPVILSNAQRDPVDVMLVLDKSGSMAQNVPGLSMTKWQVLQESVQAFLQAYRLFGEDADRIGVTYFDNSRLDFGAGGLVDFNPPMNPIPLTGPGSVQADMMAKSPGGMTCLGGGILAGYFAFDAMHPNRNMIIFTDGLQNMEPSVSQAIASDMVINDYNVRPDGTGFPAPPLDLKDPTLDFSTYTIAIGDNALTVLLQDIAGAPVNTVYDGSSEPLNSMTDLDMELPRIFDGMFVDALDQLSPQLVDVRRVQGNTSTSFIVNPSADKLLIRIAGDPASVREARIKIEKDGRDYSSRIMPGSLTFRTFFIDSAAMGRYNTDLSGAWRVSISGPSSRFQVTCMVNDEMLDVSAAAAAAEYAPGDTIALETILAYSGDPVTDASAVIALVAKPGVDTNDLFAQAASVDPVGEFPTEPDSDPGQSKYEALIAFDTNFVASLQPVIDTVRLIHESDGKYGGSFYDTEESGTYRVVFRMTGNNADTGPFERFVMRSVVLDFGEADPAGTGFQVIQAADQGAYFQLMPKNKFGHLLGPNRLTQIQFTVNGDPVQLTDKLDGSYEADVPDRSIFNPDPRVVVDIKGATFYDDKFSGIEGSDLTFWDKYRLWLILGILLVLLIFFLIRRGGT
jgi:hypothetical protein